MPSDIGSILFLLLPLLLLGYVFLAQRRRVQQMQAVQASVAVGDQVRTTSGLYGHVVSLDDSEVSLEVAPGVVVRFDRRAIDVTLPAKDAEQTGSSTDDEK